MNRNTVLQTLMEILKKQFHGRQIFRWIRNSCRQASTARWISLKLS